MKAAILLLGVAFVVLVSGCTSTGSILADREAAERGALDALSEEPCETVQCGYREQTCPDGTVVQCQEQCARGLCQPCIVSCSRHQAPASAAPPVDLCAGILCPTKAYCADGSEVPCPSSCDTSTGICTKCEPDCSHVAAGPGTPPSARSPPAPAQPPSAPPAPPPAPPPSARISAISFAVPGEKDDPNLEWVELSGSGDLAGWTLSDRGDKNLYTFPAFTLSGSVRVHSGKGINSASALYWGRSISVWNNDGDTATLRDKSGATIDERSGP